jgi:hypothetical protein
MAQIFRGRVRDTTTTTGTGAKTVSGTAPLGYRTFSAVMAVGDVIWAAFAAQTTTNWEIGLYQYTAANTLTAVSIIDSSNAGSAVNFPAGTTDVYAISPIETTTFSNLYPGGRLTNAQANPTPGYGNVAGATTIYYVPYSHQGCPVYDAALARFHMIDIGASGLSQALSDTTKSPAAAVANSVYDMFVWVDAGGVVRCTRGAAWTNTSARSLSLARIGAVLTNGAAITNGPGVNLGTYVGSVATNASGTVDMVLGSAVAGGGSAKLGVWNYFNRVDVATTVRDTTASWTYASSALRSVNNSAGNSIQCLFGVPDEPFRCECTNLGQTTTATAFSTCGIGINSTTALPTNCLSVTTTTTAASGAFQGGYACYNDYLQGWNTLYALEVSPQSQTVTFYSVGGGGNSQGLVLNYRM